MQTLDAAKHTVLCQESCLLPAGSQQHPLQCHASAWQTLTDISVFAWLLWCAMVISETQRAGLWHEKQSQKRIHPYFIVHHDHCIFGIELNKTWMHLGVKLHLSVWCDAEKNSFAFTPSFSGSPCCAQAVDAVTDDTGNLCCSTDLRSLHIDATAPV